MKIFHNGRKYKVYSKVKVPAALEKDTVKGYLYFIKIGDGGRLAKIGTTNDIKRRMIEHAKYYGEPIYIYWISPKLSKYTTLRVEDRQKKTWIEEDKYLYLRNDRFVLPEDCKKVVVTIRKNYEISLV